jgi:hypothetical protein
VTILSSPLYPDLETLTAGLQAFLDRGEEPQGRIKIVARRPINLGTYPKEIVQVRLDRGGERRLFCKYGGPERGADRHAAHGHRGGLAYEERVYQHFLVPSPLPVPTFYGAYQEINGRRWLILASLEGAMEVSKAPEPAGMEAAARWIGQFHTLLDPKKSPAAFLRRYDRSYYLGWVRRTLRYAAPLSLRWLPPLCHRAEELLAELSTAPEVLIHGEYYPKNILFKEGEIYPIDWESAAVAAGEIDLAALIEQWPEETASLCKAAYRSARQQEGAHSEFEHRLDLAILYFHFRWLGDRPEWTQHELGRFEQLRRLAEDRGWI